MKGAPGDAGRVVSGDLACWSPPPSVTLRHRVSRFDSSAVEWVGRKEIGRGIFHVVGESGELGSRKDASVIGRHVRLESKSSSHVLPMALWP